MKVIYNDILYDVVEEKDDRVYMVDKNGEEKDIAKSTFEARATEYVPPVKKSREEYLNELVSFEAIYDGEKYKDDIVVTINGKNWQIKRGVKVRIPRFVYLTIENAERQKVVASRTSEAYANHYRDKVRARFY